MKHSLYEIESMRRFARLELLDDRIPDETTILKFRYLLERHDLTHVLFQVVDHELQDSAYPLSKGTMMDATLISAPGSTKNASNSRDPQMHQTRKGKDGWFGMKIHTTTPFGSRRRSSDLW